MLLPIALLLLAIAGLAFPPLGWVLAVIFLLVVASRALKTE